MEARLEPGKLPAAALALLVHVLFFALLVFGFSWQTREAGPVMVDLWSNLPAAPTRSTPPPPKAAPKVEPKPVPRPTPRVEPKPAAKVETPKPDIALKAKQEEKKRKEQKQREALEKQQRLDKELERQAQVEQQIEAARQQQVQQEMARIAQARQAAAQQSVIDDYTNRIRMKIRGYVNQQLCGTGNPQLEFDIALLPTGQLRGNPILRKGSGIPACDTAVENAILQAEPLPVPAQPEIFASFRELHLKFKPNE
jgi:colicin import membrane protein